MQCPRHPSLILASAFVSFAAATGSRADLVTDSALDFSGTQGLAGWHYGQFNQDANFGDGYQVADFEQFAPEIFRVESQLWDVRADSGAPWTNIGATTWHPNGEFTPDPTHIWAVRRWVSTVSGEIRLTGHIAKFNISQPTTLGVRNHFFLDGSLFYTQQIAGGDGVGYDFDITLSVQVGSVIDFALDPWGSSRSDGSYFRAQISTVPAPGALALVPAALFARGRRRR